MADVRARPEARPAVRMVAISAGDLRLRRVFSFSFRGVVEVSERRVERVVGRWGLLGEVLRRERSDLEGEEGLVGMSV